MVDHIVPVQRVVLGQQRDHAFGPREARVLGLRDLVQQAGVGGVVQVAEEVDADPVLRPAGNLHAGHERHADFERGAGRFGPAVGGVMVRQGYDVQPRRSGGCHDGGWRLRAV
jgi:hypothetical protein